jgi:hypothetical protein
MAKHNRRQFLQRAAAAILGGGAGAGFAARMEDAPPPPPAEPNAQNLPAPFVHPVPEELLKAPNKPLEDMRRQQAEQAARARQRQQNPKPGDKEERIVKGAVAGAVVTLGAQFVLGVNSKRNAEGGATQNDQERVEWERRRQIRQEMEDRYENNRGRDD